MIRVVFALSLAVAVVAAPALAHDGHEHSGMVVAELEGPVDQRVIDFVADALASGDASLFVLRIDSPGVASGDIDSLVEAVRVEETPVAAWIGPEGAVAYGGALQLAAAADYSGAAPGTRLGFTAPTVAGGEVAGLRFEDASLQALRDTTTTITEDGPHPSFLDGVSPSVGQFIASLDGVEVGGTVLETADQIDLADGGVATVLSGEVRFLKPGLLTRTLRLSIRPEATFFFLMAGLALVAFELYAAGIGVTAGVASLLLILSAYGLSVLPVRWWAVAAAAVGLFLYTWDFQRNELGWRSILGTGGLILGGLTLADTAPQFASRWWVVLLVVIGIGLFYVFAMSTVVRSRFSTRTIGREYLVGRSGVAESPFDPDGLVAVDGASWRGTAHRAAGIEAGDTVTVLAVKGIVLEVEPTVGKEVPPGAGRS